ncbi:MAG: hypothetical protein DCF23_12895 [Cyanobium sp.]|nr:MAG: hypothetical protein DCF23_12895 [Cyanobium sp.]
MKPLSRTNATKGVQENSLPRLDSIGSTAMASFIGTSTDDVVLAVANYNYLYGADGNDILESNRTGLDVIEGGRGDDSLFIIDGLGAYGSLYGGDGNDGIIGGGLNDYLEGGQGNDFLFGNAGRDQLYGGGGRDLVIGGEDDDTLYGGDGDDGQSGSAFSFAFGAGDRAWSGTPGLFGGTGNDFIDGGNGDDFLAGDEGDDKLFGGTGNDYFDGGEGNDFIYTSFTASAFSDAPSSSFAQGWWDNDTIICNGKDIAFGGYGNDLLYGTSSNSVILYGNSGFDTLIGGSGADVLFGGDGFFDNEADYLQGNGGNDVLYGGWGADVFDLRNDARNGEHDYIGELATKDTNALRFGIRYADTIVLPSAYSTSTTFYQYGADTIIMLGVGSGSYYCYATNTLASDVQSRTVFA